MQGKDRYKYYKLEKTMSLEQHIETPLIGIEGHIKIWDPESGEVLVRRRNAVNYENMSIAIANLLASEAGSTSTYEVTTTSSGYTGGGNTLTASADPVLSGDTACVKFNDTSWTSASFTARGCLIYNTTAVTGFTTNRAVCAINFGSDKTVTSGTFTIEFPAQTATNAIVQIA